MHPFEQTISVIGPIVGGIIVLTLFFKLIGWMSNTSGTNRIKFKGVLDDHTPCTIHAAGGKKFENVRPNRLHGLGIGKTVFPLRASRDGDPRTFRW